jgi:hypothetical protein
MNEKHNPPRTQPSQEALARIRQRARAFSETTAEVIYTAVRRSMEDIDADIASGGGKYIGSGGKLSRLEVYRRSGISQVTVANGHLYELLQYEVDVWLKERAGKVAA